MSRSLNWCKDSIKKYSNLDVLTDAEWSEIELNKSMCNYDENYRQIISEIIETGAEFKLKKSLDNNDDAIKVNIKYDPDCDFDCFACESCRCDGTILFLLEQQQKLIRKICLLNTVCKTKMPTVPVEELTKYSFVYTIGNFVSIEEFSEEKFKTKEKPWLMSRFTTLLPYKFDVIEN